MPLPLAFSLALPEDFFCELSLGRPIATLASFEPFPRLLASEPEPDGLLLELFPLFEPLAFLIDLLETLPSTFVSTALDPPLAAFEPLTLSAMLSFLLLEPE